MGKRKAARKPVVRRKQVLDKEFECLFCNHEKSISVQIDKDSKLGHLSCKSCGVTFQSVCTHLTEPVDVYADWVDACEGVSKRDVQA